MLWAPGLKIDPGEASAYHRVFLAERFDDGDGALLEGGASGADWTRCALIERADGSAHSLNHYSCFYLGFGNALMRYPFCIHHKSNSRA